MAYDTQRLGIRNDELSGAIGRLVATDRPRLRRLWAYYQNPMRLWNAEGGNCHRPYRQAQEWGLPARITGCRPSAELFAQEPGDASRKEVVIENDIGWRVDTMVDYLFGKPLVIRSAAMDGSRRAVLDLLVRAIIAHNGGIQFLQQLALLGGVYGFVDVLVKLLPAGDAQDEAGVAGMQELGEAPACHEPRQTGMEGEGGTGPEPAASEGAPAGADGEQPRSSDDSSDPGATRPSLDAIARIARRIRLEIVEPARALPFLSPRDYRVIEAYAQCYSIPGASKARGGRAGWLERLFATLPQWNRAEPGECEQTQAIELVTPTRWQKYEGETLVDEGSNDLGQLPLVHIQNTPAPFQYAGASEVEGLIPLQDELNTRLSDRASRITLQSFKMYLGKGIENFAELPVGPGRMWTAEDENAGVQEFGGDDNCPSELAHIADLREALDKASGVSPIAAGAIKNRIGRLTSAAALRLTLIALLSKTEKKRTTYGLGIQRMIELALTWLDKAGLFHTTPQERRIEIHWPSPLPENQVEELQEAESKLKIGVAKEVVLKELGY